jgi:hypothetical protein
VLHKMYGVMVPQFLFFMEILLYAMGVNVLCTVLEWVSTYFPRRYHCERNPSFRFQKHGLTIFATLCGLYYVIQIKNVY